MRTTYEQTPAPGTVLPRLMEFVAACRAADPDGEYPHVGDVQWWFRDASAEDAASWRFWSDEQGRMVAAGQVADDQIFYAVHLQARGPELEAAIRAWAMGQLEQHARRHGEAAYAINDEACEDDPARIALLEREGYVRGDWYFLRYHRPLDEPIPAPQLPQGFGIRHVAGEPELAERAALHRDSFYPYTSKTYEAATELYGRCMRMPGYDPQLDLVVVAPDGRLAAGCICWMDQANQVGLFEPVGTRPAFRRMGLATALVREGLRRLQAQGATRALVSANHPGTSGGRVPAEFMSSRFVFEAAGFRLLRRVFRYSKTCQLP
jgi:mycothiol synthase